MLTEEIRLFNQGEKTRMSFRIVKKMWNIFLVHTICQTLNGHLYISDVILVILIFQNFAHCHIFDRIH